MDSEHGNQQVSDKKLLDAFNDIEGPFVTASELERELPITRTAINKRLQRLYQEGRIEKKQPISHMIGWWIPDQSCSDK